MCLVMGIKYAGKDNPAWHEAHFAIIKLLPWSWDKIDGEPDRLLTVFRKAQIAVDIMGSNPDFKPTRRSLIHGVLATHLAVKGIQAKGCNGCPLHCYTLRNGSYYWRNAPFSEGYRAHEPGIRAHLAVAGAHDDDSDTPDTAMIVINRALNDDHFDPDLRREIAAAAKTYDFARLEALSDRCDQDVDNRTKCSSPLASLAPATLHFLKTILKCNVARVILQAPTPNISLCSFFMDLLFCYFECYGSSIFSRETREVSPYRNWTYHVTSLS